jgi:hypothetical protein
VRNLDQILFKKLQKGKKQKVEMSDAIQQKVYKYYNEQNQLLAKEYNLELKKYGYINE